MSKPLFLSGDGNVLQEMVVCSGLFPLELGSKPCPYSNEGKFPGVITLQEGDSIDKGKPGNLCPACAKQSIGSVEHWRGHQGTSYPKELEPLRLFKCKMWFWMVVEGLEDANPTIIKEQK